jgi:thiamine-monophosphate kinase
MACEPRAAIVSLAITNTMSLDDVKWLYEGMAALADRYDCPLVGGDTTSWSAPLAIDVMVMAEPMHPRGPVQRSTARPGDTIFVSGPVGGSLAGKHLDFEPRLDVARAIAGETALHALMDISDGIAMDLHRLCDASGCDAELLRHQLERAISDAARAATADDGRDPLDHALSDGEDFELLVIGEPELERFDLIPVGRMTARSEPSRTCITLVHSDGKTATIEPTGYEHFQ